MRSPRGRDHATLADAPMLASNDLASILAIGRAGSPSGVARGADGVVLSAPENDTTRILPGLLARFLHARPGVSAETLGGGIAVEGARHRTILAEARRLNAPAAGENPANGPSPPATPPPDGEGIELHRKKRERRDSPDPPPCHSGSPRA